MNVVCGGGDAAADRERRSTTAASLVPARPVLANEATLFIQMEREGEEEFRPQMLEALQSKVHRAADSLSSQVPTCGGCGNPMSCHDTRPVSWLTRLGRLRAPAQHYRCGPCKQECRPLG